jgi:D-alanyl-D-alanine carboxypeptidase/D-alanyl-D-alanine-endopeptidase (penicillin-binding protein 4)
MRRLALLLTLLLVAPSLAEPTTRPGSAHDIGPIINRLADTGATVAARVVDLETGEVLFEQLPDKPMIPASNMKLPVSAAALDRLGRVGDDGVLYGDLTTTYRLVGEHLWVLGSGDPATGDPTIAKENGESIYAEFDAVAAKLKERGITELAGIWYADNALGGERVHPTWERGDLIFWYACPVSGLAFNNNCIDVVATPAELGEPATLEVTPMTTDSVHVVNLTRSTEFEGMDVSIERTHIAPVYAVVGDVHARREFISRPVTDPGAFFADVLATRLREQGVAVGDDVRPAEDPQPDGQMIHEVNRPLSPVLRRVNTNSQNLFAEALCRKLGDDGSWETGGAAVAKFLAGAGIDAEGFRAADGSGLSRANRVSVRQLSDLMAFMAAHEHADVFEESLSIGGQTGTLARRFRGTDGRVRGKTGFISGVRALTVLITTDSGRELVASILYNDIPGRVRPYQDLQDEAVMFLMDDDGE